MWDEHFTGGRRFQFVEKLDEPGKKNGGYLWFLQFCGIYSEQNHWTLLSPPVWQFCILLKIQRSASQLEQVTVEYRNRGHCCQVTYFRSQKEGLDLGPTFRCSRNFYTDVLMNKKFSNLIAMVQHRTADDLEEKSARIFLFLGNCLKTFWRQIFDRLTKNKIMTKELLCRFLKKKVN